MRFKDDSINPIGIRPELLFAVLAAQEVYSLYGHEMVITSINDAQHSTTSLHYSGAAVDLRTVVVDADEDWEKVARDIKEKLNKHYDVIAEHHHIHIEWQPRG